MDATCHFERPVREFLTYLRIEAGLAPATLDAYGRDLNDLVAFLRPHRVAIPQGVTPQHLAEHLRDLHRSRDLQPSSIARHLTTLRVFFRFHKANGVIDDNPARLLEPPMRWKRLPGVLSPKKMRCLLDAPSPETGRRTVTKAEQQQSNA
jgi:integrase/recombinase XerD